MPFRRVVDASQDDRLNVYLTPPDGLIYLLAKKEGKWGPQSILSDILKITERGCQAAIPVSAFEEHFSGAEIAASCVDLKLSHPGAPNEVFAFPGSGCLRDAPSPETEED